MTEQEIAALGPAFAAVPRASCGSGRPPTSTPKAAGCFPTCRARVPSHRVDPRAARSRSSSLPPPGTTSHGRGAFQALLDADVCLPECVDENRTRCQGAGGAFPMRPAPIGVVSR